MPKKKNGLHIDTDGSKQWYLNDMFHRTDGPAVEYADGTKVWYLNDKLHRADGPAVVYSDGSKRWWVDGKRHRTDGPAAEHADGSKEWWVDGRFLGYNDKGFWALWDVLDNTQRNNISLLMHLPKA